MSTTSPNFALVMAQSTDQVDVSAHIANNFSTLDSILSIVHTGSGELKDGLTFVNPTLSGIVTVTGTVSASLVSASTGSFQTIIATGGVLTINTLTVGTMAIPTAIGSSGQLLGVSAGQLTFLSPSAASGPNNALSNLANVAINTNLNTFSAGFVTVNRIVATSGSLTGVTAFQATTGTFTNLTVLTTASIPTLIGTNATITNIVVGFATGTGITVSSATAGVITASAITASATTIIAALSASSFAATNVTAINATVGALVATSFTGTTAVVANMTASALRIGTFNMPATIGSTAQVLTVTTGNAVWANPSASATNFGTIFGTYASGSATNGITLGLVMTAGDVYHGYFTFDGTSTPMNTSPVITFNGTAETTGYFSSVTAGTRPSIAMFASAPVTSGLGVGFIVLMQETNNIRVLTDVKILSLNGSAEVGGNVVGHKATQLSSIAFIDPSGNGRFSGSIRFVKVRTTTA